MGRRPIAIGKINQRAPPQEGRYLILAFYAKRGAPHLRARCARSACRRCSLQFALLPSAAATHHAGLVPIFASLLLLLASWVAAAKCYSCVRHFAAVVLSPSNISSRWRRVEITAADATRHADVHCVHIYVAAFRAS